MLLIKQPKDHVLFLKQSLCHAARRLDVPRVIIFAPPDFDKLQVSDILGKKLNISTITFKDILGDEEYKADVPTGTIIKKLRLILREQMKNNCDGWILLDFPKTDNDARLLQRSGIIPTHVIDIVLPSDKHDVYTILENKSSSAYYKEIKGLRRMFSNSITTINVKDENIECIAEKCLNSVKRRFYFHGTTKLRILLIDTVDSIRGKYLAKFISQSFNLAYINFQEVLEKISLCESALGDKLLEIKESVGLNNVAIDLKIEAFELYLEKSVDLKQGWILTGFVDTLDDFKNLDLTDSPPNRILIVVPKDYNENESVVSESDKECGCEDGFKDIIKYAGSSANIIKEYSDLKVMKEKTEIILMQPPLCVPPRMPREPFEMQFEDIEFDPDDELPTELLRDIREDEPELPLL